MSDVRELLISLTKNERPWAIRLGRSGRSGRTEEMSDVSESLILLTENECMSELLIFLSKSEIKWANSQPCWIYVCI